MKTRIGALLESQQRDCMFFIAKDKKWYYFIAHNEYGEYPNGDFWGPFPSEEAADAHLSKTYSNPGGYTIDRSGKRDVPKNLKDPKKGRFQ